MIFLCKNCHDLNSQEITDLITLANKKHDFTTLSQIEKIEKENESLKIELIQLRSKINKLRELVNAETFEMGYTDSSGCLFAHCS